MPEQLIANYINKKRIDAGLTYEAIASQKNIAESTVKNLCKGTTDNPGIKTILPVMEAVGGSYDEMLFPDKSKDEVKETSLLAIKDIYEFQLNALKETNEEHIHNIRSHYEQHHEDLKENYEKRLADKRELINTLKTANTFKNIAIGLLVGIFIILFIMELMHPEHGWLRY